MSHLPSTNVDGAFRDEGVINCLNSDNSFSSNSKSNKGENKMSNVSINVNVNEVSNMSLLERAKRVIKEQKEAIVLVQRLEALRAELKVAEESLEKRLNSIESIDIEKVNSEIQETSSKLEATKEVLTELDDLDMCIECPREPKVGVDIPIDIGPNEPNPPSEQREEPEDLSCPSSDVELDEILDAVPIKEDEIIPEDPICVKAEFTMKALEMTEENKKNPEVFKASLENTFNQGPTGKDKVEFMKYFNKKNYFLGNGKKLLGGDYEALIRTIESKEGSKVTPAAIAEGKLKWYRKMLTIHNHMFDEECLADLRRRVEELESTPWD